MRHIRQKLFTLNYLGSLLLITAAFIPIVKFNNQSFAFIDQFFYLSFAIVILSTITVILVTMKKFKLSLIPTILNIAIITYGIYDILSIDGIKSTPDFSYGIALIIFPLGIILNIVGGLLTIGHNAKKNDKEKKIQPALQNNNDLEIEEPKDIVEEPIINLDYNEQIPLENLLNQNVNNDNENTNISNDNVLANELEQSDNHSNNNEELNSQEEIINSNFNVDNSSQDNSQIFDKIEDISILKEDDELLEEIEEYQYNDDEFFEEITENDVSIPNSDIITIPSIDEEILMDDIPNNQDISTPDIPKNVDVEIPDIDLNNENIMTNNTQVADEPKPQFMALNPSDIKVDNKKPLFKKKEKKEEDPLERIMKRNIPTTLGRTCQFCNTPLGDDERICPICGRIN